MALVLVLAGAFVYVFVSGELRGTLDDGLRARAGELAGLVEGSPGAAGLDLSPSGEAEEGFSQILAADGRVIATTLSSATGAVLDEGQLDRALLAPGFFDVGAVAGIDGEIRVRALPAELAGSQVVVAAGASTEDREEALAGLLGAFAIGGPIALLVASGLGYALAAAGLRPIEAMRRRASEIGLRRGGGERLPLPGSEDELRRLGETLNEMLERIERSVERERQLVADASHELRSPLAVLRAELELGLAGGRSEDELRAAMGAAIEETDRLSRLADDLLLIARADQDGLPIAPEPVRVDRLLERMAGRFRRQADSRGRAIAVDAGPALEVALDPLRIEQAVGNLVDNALRHGEGTVTLSGGVDDGRLRLMVADEGPGPPDGFAEQAFERFTRADPARGAGGVGLGLAIVQAIARAHGGTARLGHSEGRAWAAIELPLARGAVPR